jgi:hypothetical protein
MSRHTSGPRDFRQTLGRNLNVALCTILRITLNRFAASTAEALWFWGFDFRKRRTTLCDAAMLLSKRS